MTVNMINIANILVSIGSGLFMVVYLGRGVTGAVEASLISAVIMLTPILLLSVKQFKIGFSLDILKKELRFSFPLIAAIGAFIIIDSSGQYFLKMFLPLSEVGLYNMGYQFGLVMMILVGGFSSSFPPYYFKYNKTGDAQAILPGILKAYMAIASVCVILLTAVSPFIFKIFTTEQFHQAYTVVPWIAVAYMLKVPYLIFLAGIYMKNKTSWQLYLELSAAVVTLLGNYFLIPLLGREASALTAVLAYSVMSLGAYWMVKRINPIPNLYPRFFWVCLALTLTLTTATTISARIGWSPLWSSLTLLGIFIIVFIPVSLREFGQVLQRTLSYNKASSEVGN